MIKINKMLGVGVLILAILMAGAVLTTATSTESNDAPEAKVGPGAEVEIMNFTLTNNDYIVYCNDSSNTINVSENLSENYNITNGQVPGEWENVSSYDAVDGDAWNSSADFIFYNASGSDAYDHSGDWLIAHNDSVTNDVDDTANITQGFDTDWHFTALDNKTKANSGFNNSTDAIVYDYCDGEYDGYFGDNFTGINITNIAAGNNMPINGSLANITLYNVTGNSEVAINTTSSGTNWINNSFADAVAFNDTSLTFNVTMTVNDTTSAWYDNFDNVDAFDMEASAELSLNASDKTIENDNTIKASHVYLDFEYYDEDVTITITLEDDDLNDDPNRIQEKDVNLDSDSDVKTLNITLEETGPDTGIFTADVITSSGTVSGNELHAEDGGNITVTNYANGFNDTATVDSSKPTDITVDSPTDLQYNKSSDTIEVNYSYTEDNPHNTTIQFVNSDGDVDAEYVIDDSAESSDKVSVNENLNLSKPDTGKFAEGLYSIKLSVEDAAGNKAENQTGDLLMIDNTGPSVVGDIENNITETDGYYNNSVAFNLTFNLSDYYGENVYGLIDNETVTLYYNNSTSEGTINLDNTTIVNDNATYKAIIDTQDDGMDDNEIIKFWVEANDTAGNPIDDGELVSYTVDIAAPEAPANLSAEADAGVINLSWDAATDNASGVYDYDIYRNDSGTEFVSGDWIANTTETSYPDDNSSLKADENYNYTVVAVDNLGHESDEATSANATFKPGDPENITFTIAGGSSIIADGRDTAKITATIVDGMGNAVGEGNLSFSTDAGIFQLENSSKSYPVGNDGSYTVNLTSATEPGVANVTASLEGEDITNTTQVYFVDDDFTFNLRAGWNQMSLPLIPADSSIEQVLAGIDDGTDVEIVWAYDAQSGNWTSYKPGGVGGELEEMVDGKGYLLKTDSTGTMNVSGYQDVKMGVNNQHAYNVYEGWNLIGFKYTGNMNSSEYLGNVATFTDYLKGPEYSVKLPDGDMKSGQGYWLAVSQDGTIYAPGYTSPD